MHSLAKIAIRVKAFGIEDAVVFDVVAINVVMFYDAGAAAELLRVVHHVPQLSKISLTIIE